MTTTIFLRFPDEATFIASLPEGFACHGETGSPLPEGITHISIVGAIYIGGQWDAEGVVIEAPTQLPGFHVNALGTLPDAWAQYVVTPSAPSRTF